jgi:hypothetical protein
MADVAFSALGKDDASQQNLMPYQRLTLHPPLEILAAVNKTG